MAQSEDQYIIWLPAKIKPILLGDSNIYHYNQNNLHIVELTNIIEQVTSNWPNYCSGDKLCLCYDRLIKNHMDQIIYSIINGYNIDINSHEMFAICLAAIINEDIDIMNMLSLKNFNFDIRFKTYIYTHHCSGRVNLIDYAIHHNKNTIAKYLLELGTKLHISDDVGADYISVALNKMNDALFDFILNTYPQYHQSLFIASICNRNIERIDKLLTTNINIKIELPTNSLHDYYHIMGNIYLKLNLDIFKLLAKYGLNITQELLQIIFVCSDINLVDYIMSEYHYIPTNKLIDSVFSNFNLKKIKLFAKHNIDLSDVKIINSHTDLIQSLEKCNLDNKSFMASMLNHYDDSDDDDCNNSMI